MAVRDYSGFQAVVNSVEKLRETVEREADKQLTIFRVIRDDQRLQLTALERMVEGLKSRSQIRNNFGFPDRLELKNVRLDTKSVNLSARSVIVETKGELSKEKQIKTDSQQPRNNFGFLNRLELKNIKLKTKFASLSAESVIVENKGGLNREKQNKADSQELAKALGSEIKKIKVGGGLGNPLQILGAGILLQFGFQIAKGIEKSLNKQFDFSFKGVGQVAGTAVTNPLQAAQDVVKMRRDSVLRRRSASMVKDIPLQKGIEIDREYNRYNTEVEKISKESDDAEKIAQMRKEAEKNHKEKLAEINKKYAEYETKIEKSTKPIIFAVGGFGGTGGRAGMFVKRTLQNTLGKKAANIESVENPETDPVFQELIDSLPEFIKNDPQFVKDIEKLKKQHFAPALDPTADDPEISKLTKNIIKALFSVDVGMKKATIWGRGYNPDAVKLAAKVADARKKNPNAPINLVGYSGGGFTVEEVLAILQEMGITDVQGTGIGTPDLGVGYKNNPNYQRVMGSTDYAGESVREMLRTEQATTTNVPGFSDTTNHQLYEYLAHPEVIKTLNEDLAIEAIITAIESRIQEIMPQVGMIANLVENLKDANMFKGDKEKAFKADYIDPLLQKIKEVNDYLNIFADKFPEKIAEAKKELEELSKPLNDALKKKVKKETKPSGKSDQVPTKQDTVETPDKVEKDTKPDDQPNQVPIKQDTVETPDKVEKETKPNDQPNQVSIKQDTPGRPDGSENQSSDRTPDIVPVGPVELPPSAGNNVDIEADPTRGGGITPLAGQLDTYQKTLAESLARVLGAEKAQTEIEIEPGFWVDVEQLNQGFVKRTQTQLILFWEKLRANLGKEINRTLAGLLGTIPGAFVGGALTGDPIGRWVGGAVGSLIAETGLQDVSIFRSLQQQGMSPATAEFWQQFGNNRKFLPNALRKKFVGYTTGSIVGRGVGDLMQVTGANQLIGALMPSWFEDWIADNINRGINTIADADLTIPNLPPIVNEAVTNLGQSFLRGQTRTALMPVREALTSAGQAIGGEGLLGEYFGNRLTGLGMGAIQDTAKASGRGVAGMIAPGLPAEVRNFIADQVIKQGVLDGTVRGQVAPFLASRAGSDLFARGVRVPITAQVAGLVNQTLDKYDPFAIAPKQSLTDEQILLNREQRIAKKPKPTNVVENLFNRIDKSVDETTKAVVGIGNGFLGFFDNIRTKTYDFAKKTAGLTEEPVTLIDQYVVYLDQLIQDAQKQAEETVKGIIPDYKNLTIPERKEAIGSYKEKVATEVKKFRMAIEDGESQIALEIGENILALVESTRKVYKDLLEAVPSDLSGTKSIQANQRYLTSIQNEVLKGQPNLKGRAKTGLMQLVGTETSEGFIKGIEERLNKARNSGKELAESAIEGAKKRLGIASPSKEFEKLGESSGEGFEIGIEKSLDSAKSAINKKIQEILDMDFYHGTSKAGAKSILEKGIDVDRVQDAVYGKGFYLTDKLGEAESYASEHRHPEVLKARLNVKNPFIVTEKGYQNFIKHAQKRGELPDPFSQEDPTGEKYQQYHRDKTKLLQKKGYDSIFVRDKGFAVAFEAEQVKLEESGKNANKSMIASIKQLLNQVFDAEIEAIKAGLAKELKGIVTPKKLDKFLTNSSSKALSNKGLDAVIYRLNNSFNLKPEHQKIVDKLALYGRTQKPSIIRMHGSDQKHKIGESVEFPSATSFTGKVDQVKKTGSLSYLKLQPGGSLYEVVNPKRGFDVPYDNSYTAPFAEEDETIASGKYKVVGKKQKTISVNYGEKDGIEKLKVTIYQLEEIRSEIDKSVSLLSKPVAQLKSAFDNLGKDTIDGFIKGVQGNQSDAIEVIAELVDSVIEKAKNDLEIQSPSKKFRKIGQQSSAGFAEGLNDGKEDVNEAVGSFWDNLENVPILGWFIKFGKLFAKLVADLFNPKSQPQKTPKKQEKVKVNQDQVNEKQDKVNVDQEAVQEILNMDFYHGTSKTGEKSILEKGIDINRVQDAVYGKGFYLANKREEAESYANDHRNPAVLKAKIKVKTPFIVTEDEYQEFIKNAQKKGELIDPFAQPDPTGKKYEQYHKDRTKLLQKKGYDSIFIKDKGFAVIFEAQQVEFEKASKKASKEITDNFYTRYIAYLDNLKTASKKHAMQNIASDDYKALSQQDKLKVSKESFTKIKEHFKEFKEAVAVGNKKIATEIGEEIIFASETLKTIYDDLLQDLNSNDELFTEIEKQKTALEKLERKTIGGKANQKGLANIALETNRSLEMGESVGDGFIQGIENKIKETGIAAKALSEEAIKETEKRLGIASPSKVFKKIGTWVVKGFNQGIDKIKNYEGVFVEIQDLRNELKELNTQAEQAYYSEVLAEVDSLRNEIKNLQIEAESVLPPPTAVDKIFDSVEKTVQATNNKVKQAVDNLQQYFNDFYNDLIAKFPVINEFKDVLLGFIASLALGNVFEFLASQLTALGTASFNAVLELESLQLALTSVTGSAEAGAKGLAFVREEAQRLGVELKTAEEAYTGFLAVTKYTVLQGKQADRIFSAFQETAARRGLSNEEQGRMFAAINQAISKRKLSAEEVRGQLGEIPGLAFESTVARSMGVNPAQLSEMMGDGLLMAEDVFPRVAALYEAENAKIAGGTETTTQALTRFQNAIVNLQRSFEGWIAPAKTFFNFFAAAIEKISEMLPDVVRYLTTFWVALYIDLGKISIGLVKFLASLKSVQAVLYVLARIAVAAFKLLYKELLIFLGQFALLTLAVDAVGAAIYVLSNNAFPELKKGIEEATDRANQLEQALQNVGKATQAIPKELPKTEEEIVTSRTWNILGWDTGFNLEGTRQFLNNIDKTLGFEPALTTVGQQELGNFQENVGGLLSQVDKNLSKQFDVEKTIKEIRELDKELTKARSRRFNIPAGDKKRYEAAIKEQQKLIEERDKKFDVTASFEKALQGDKAEIEEYLKALDTLVAKRGITEDAEKSIRAQLEQRLKDIDTTSTAFDDLMSNLQKSVNALTLALRTLNEQAAYFNETLQRNATNARVQFMRRARAAGLGSQARDLGLDEIEQNTLEARIVFLRDQLGAVNEYLSKPDFADVLTDLRQQAEDMGLNLENTATIDRLISENRSQQETAVLNTLKEQLRLQDELGQAEENLEQSISSTRSGITDLNNSVEEFFFNLTQQIDEAIVEVDRILNKLKYTDIKNRLQRALVPGSDTFVNGLVGQIQGIFDQASGIVEQLLGQRSARINLVGERRGLQVELENFTRNLGGATEALELFRQGLLGGQPSGSGQPSASGRFAIGTVGATGIGTGAHLDIRGKDRQGNRLPESRLRELLSLVVVGGKPLSEQLDKITSGYGHRRPPTRGASSFHPALDFGFSRGTPIEFTGQAVSARTFFDKGGGGNVVEITLPNGEKLQLLHLDSVANLGTIQRGRVNTPGNTTGNTPHRGMPNVPFASLIEGAARQYGLDPLLFAALIKKESGFRQIDQRTGKTLQSYNGTSFGIAQLKNSTARELGVNPHDITQNLIGGAEYFARMLKQFGGNIELALAAYNAGPGNVQKYGGIPPFTETQSHVRQIMQYYREFQQMAKTSGAGQAATANQPAASSPTPSDAPTPPTAPIPNVNNAAAEGLTNRLIQIKENQVNLGDAGVRQEIEGFFIQLQQTQQEILRQMDDSIRQSTQSVIDAQNSLQDIRSQYKPQTQSAQLETELRGVENQFRSLDNQLFEQERGLTDNVQGLDNLLGQIKPILEILSASTNQVDKESASFLRGLIGRIEQDKTTYSGMLTEIQKLRGQLKEGKLDAENFVKAQAKLRTIQADLERIGTELSIAQEQNNLEQERAIALLQSRQQLELDLLQIAQDFEGEDRNKRLALAKEQARLREQEIEYQFQSKKLSQETELITQRLAIAQSLSNLGKINELELLQSQKQLEQEILEIKKQYPDLADQESRINLAKEQARLREIGIENNYYNQRWQRQQELFDMESRITEARATRLERSGQPFEAAAMREELAFRAELLRYEQEIEAIRQRYTDPADEQTKDELIRNAGILLELNLEQIDQQFKDLGETIRDTVSGPFATFLEDTLTGTKSIGDAFLDMAQSILKSLAQIAVRMAIGGLFRLFKIPIPGFADGGTIPNFAEGDTVKSAKVANLTFGNAQGNPFKGIQEALTKEGPQGVLAVFTPGEEILSLRTGEAQRYQSLKSRLGKNPLAKIGNFADGGTIGINESLLAGLNYGMPTAGRLPNNFGQSTQISNYGGDRSVTVNVTAPNPSAFNASERQIGRTIAEYLSRV